MTTTQAPQRSYDRPPDGLRPTTIQRDFVKPATGSALITQGETRVICTADADAFARIGSRFLQLPMGTVAHVDLPLMEAIA